MGALLVTGAAGYIGSHMCLELLRSGFDVIAVDNLCNSSASSLDQVQAVSGKALTFVRTDLREAKTVARVFAEHDIEGVLHFAALKSVRESVERPLDYFDNNVNATLGLLQAMQTAGVRTLVFSSSATVYGKPNSEPKLNESAATDPVNPYGRSKLLIEEVLETLPATHPDWRISILRYFNPAGADPSGEVGEDPVGAPDNLIPYIAQVAAGKRSVLKVFGDDYPTRDGTGIRDYIHVLDLVRGHLKALRQLRTRRGLTIYNLGRGRGYSVLEVLRAFETASGRTIPYQVVDRRAGDLAEYFADPSKANRELGWCAEYDIDRMCEDAWRWHSSHPDGYA